MCSVLFVRQFHRLQGVYSLRLAFICIYVLFVYVFVWFCRRRDFWRAVYLMASFAETAFWRFLLEINFTCGGGGATPEVLFT